MAVDEGLLAEASGIGEPILRVYRWDHPTLSFGYFIKEADALAARRPGEATVRRWTGGGLVHHESTMTWSLAVPAVEAFCNMRRGESYARLHEALAVCLTLTGMHGISVVPATGRAPAGGLCSEAPAPGDLLWQVRKLAGAGQRRTRVALLHQGVIFRPESELPEDFPLRLAASLAAEIREFSPPGRWAPPVSRYEDPVWNSRR